MQGLGHKGIDRMEKERGETKSEEGRREGARQATKMSTTGKKKIQGTIEARCAGVG